MTSRNPFLLLASLLLLLSLSGCWEQFTPADDDDTSVDDDDTSSGDDDDSSATDDDDTSVDDDDTSVDDDDTSVDDDDTSSGLGSCTSVGELACDQIVPVDGNDGTGSSSVIESYSCFGDGFDAAEMAWTWTPASTDPVTLTLTGLTDDLDLFVLEETATGECDPLNCAASSNLPGTNDETIDFIPEPSTIYHVVVDGFFGATSAFELALDCGGLGDDDDSASGDDDDSSVDPCDAPLDVQATVSLTNSAGNPTTQLTVADPMTVEVAIQNVGGGSQTQAYASNCTFQWDLLDLTLPAANQLIHGGPLCMPGGQSRTYGCGDSAVVESDVVIPCWMTTGSCGDQIPSKDYSLVISDQSSAAVFADQTFTVTVP